MSDSSQLNPVVRRFIEETGNATQSFGIGRVVGQIYAYIYFSREPRNLADMQTALGISKGSASTCIRQLEQWGAVKKVWIRGDRKDYYEANEWLGHIVKNAVLDTVGAKMASYQQLLEEMNVELSELQARGADGDAEFIRERIGHLRAFQEKAQKAWNSPIVRMLLK